MSLAFELHRSSRRLAESAWDLVADLDCRRAELPRWRVGMWLWLALAAAWRSREALRWEADARHWLERAISQGELTR